MEADIVDGKIGSEGKYDIEFKGGQLVIALDYVGGLVGAGVVVKLSADAVITALENAIPGNLDNLALEALRQLLKK